MEDNKNSKRTCVFCNKTIKKFTKTKDNPNRKTHRKCWLKNRKFEDRCYDYFFTERDNKNAKLNSTEYKSIKPEAVFDKPEAVFDKPEIKSVKGVCL
jgi:hypothetical protein